jgi:hypothetical protein
MTVKRTIRKYTGSVNLTHPSLKPAYIVMLALALVGVYIALDLSKWTYGKGKSVVGGAMPSGGGKAGVRDELGI